MSTFHTVALPGPLVLVPGRSLDVQIRRQLPDHPRMPGGVPELAADLNGRREGVPATFDAPREGGDWSLQVYGETFVLRLFLTEHKDAYLMGAISPLRIRDHHRVAQGCLMVRPMGWQPVLEHRQIPGGSDAYWPVLFQEWDRLGSGTAAERGAAPLTGAQTAFLDTVDGVIDASERITTGAARATPPFPYRKVASTGGQRSGTRAVYEFELVSASAPQEGVFVQVKGQAEQRGQVTRVAGGVATVRFDDPVDWARIPPQGELEATFSSVVFAKQREAVALLRSGQSTNPGLLSTLVEHRVAAIRRSGDNPTERLDDDQLTAFRKALAIQDMLLVLGPPGTGKTRTISQIAGAVAGSGGTRPVLLTSHSNRAVDNILPRLPAGLIVVRVGNDGRVTEEGRPYLLERQASDLRQEILNSTGARRGAYDGVPEAERWAAELGRLLHQLAALRDERSRASDDLVAARRAAGGPAQLRVDELQLARERLRRALTRVGQRTARLTRLRSGAARRTTWWLLGALFAGIVMVCERRLAKAREAVGRLGGDEARLAAELPGAEAHLEAVTRDLPQVRAARAAVADAERRGARCQAEASHAARTCLGALPEDDLPGEVRVMAHAQATDRDLTDLHGWLTARLPLLSARGRLLTEWHRQVSGETDQLYPELIRYAQVIAATSIGAASRPELAGVEFDLAIVDEAGQIGIADALVPLTRARRAVLVGDHQQLPPYLDSEVQAWGQQVADRTVLDLLTKSALERLVEALPATHVVPLTVQRRMPAVIADFASAQFYQGTLRTGVRREHHDPLFSSALAFVDTARLPESERFERSGRSDERFGQRGYTNPAEAALLIRLAHSYHRRGLEWAVIVPYRAQAARISAELIRLTGDPEVVGLNVGTVDSFQGGERDVILYGFTRSNPYGAVGFLKERRRVNVALTRARQQLVLVGDMNTLTSAGDRGFRELAMALRAHLAGHGDIRQYRQVLDELTGSRKGGVG